MNKFTEAIAVTSPTHPASVFYSQDLKLSMRYTYNDLIRMEKWVKKRYPVPTEVPEEEHYNILALGLYLGQVLVHSFNGAAWEYEDIENPFDARIIIPIEGDDEEPLQLDPFTCVFMFIVESRKDYSIIEWYGAIRSIYEGREPRNKRSKKLFH